MVVIIPHSTEELKLISLQKELIDLLFSNDRIIYRTTPLWIELPDDFSAFDKESLKACSKNVQLVELGEVEIEKDNKNLRSENVKLSNSIKVLERENSKLKNKEDEKNNFTSPEFVYDFRINTIVESIFKDFHYEFPEIINLDIVFKYY